MHHSDLEPSAERVAERNRYKGTSYCDGMQGKGEANLVMTFQFKSGFLAFAIVTLGCVSSSFGQVSEPVTDQQLSGAISGTVTDESGAVVAGARVKLSRDGQTSSGQAPAGQPSRDPSPTPEALAGNDGQFTFANIAAGPFHLTITSAGFQSQTLHGVLHPGETYVVPKIALAVATAVTDVEVTMTQIEVAQEQIRVEEKQRVFGAIPNFYVSYVPDAAPLTAKQKFGLAWKSTIDPINFVIVGGIAGVQQATNDFSGYGQGAKGYAKRYGAAYADSTAGTFIGSAILPSLLKQDPRYFYKGTGSRRSRLLYAMANAVICKGDNGHWQANYSNILGNLAAGGISNLYYPAKDREGVELTFENGLIGVGATAAENLFQEFLVRKLTPKTHTPPAQHNEIRQ
jgi:hypothetical protein